MKKLTALILLAIFSLTLISSLAKGEGFMGNGSVDNPYLINTAEDLKLLSQMVYDDESFEGKYFLLTDDITLNDTAKFYSWEYNPPENIWKPIGSPSGYFKGIFDGNGKTVKGIYLSDNSKNYAGLFGHIKNAEIKNLNIEKSFISARNEAGLVSGFAENSKIENVRAEGVVSGRNNAGGIVGSTVESTIVKAISSVEVSSLGNSGGIAGYGSKSDMTYVTSKRDVKGVLTAGGIVGHLVSGKVQNAYSEGEITAESYSGGIAGYVPEDGEIIYSYSVGNIISEKAAGGIAGFCLGNVDSIYFKGFAAGEYKGAVAGINSPISEEKDFAVYGETQNAYFAYDRCENAFGYTEAEEEDYDVLGLKASKINNVFIKTYILNGFISEENLSENPEDVWTFEDKNPMLWFESEPILEDTPEKPEIGIKTGEVVSTDIRAYINGNEIKAVNIGGKMAIALKDLREFGFEVLFDEEKKTVKVSHKGGEIKSSYVYEESGLEVGSYISDVLSTDIVAYLDGGETESFNAEGFTHVYFRSLSLYGEISFDEGAREAKLFINK